MSAQEVIEQIKALPLAERAEVTRFVLQEDDSWIPESFKEGMADIAAGRCRPACVNLFEVRTANRVSPLLRIFLLRLVGGIEGVLQGDEIFARLQRIQRGLLGLELLVGVVGRLDGQAN